jgi:phosphoribosylformylglycinamidine (FGAM) synthase PurS component
MKYVDMLSEDPEISGQRYALVSIVGPHLPQKCDVWGLKVRGVADSVAEAKQMTKKLMKFDNMYDIYTVSVGKFFPLNVEPYDVKDVEHDHEKLNELMKNYLKNREDANAHYHQRKQDMMEKAIREGTKESQAELANKPEHPIAVLQRKQTLL